MYGDNRKRIRWAAIGCLLFLCLVGCRRLATRAHPCPPDKSAADCDCAASCPPSSPPAVCQVIPRFHPVPTRPVFSPAGQCPPVVPPTGASKKVDDPAAPFAEPAREKKRRVTPRGARGHSAATSGRIREITGSCRSATSRYSQPGSPKLAFCASEHRFGLAQTGPGCRAENGSNGQGSGHDQGTLSSF